MENEKKQAYTPQENMEAAERIDVLLKDAAEIARKHGFAIVAITAVENCNEDPERVRSSAMMAGNGGTIIDMVFQVAMEDKNFEMVVLEAGKMILEERNPLLSLLVSLAEMK